MQDDFHFFSHGLLINKSEDQREKRTRFTEKKCVSEPFTFGALLSPSRFRSPGSGGFGPEIFRFRGDRNGRESGGEEVQIPGKKVSP